MPRRSEGPTPAEFRVRTVARILGAANRRAKAYADVLDRSARKVLGQAGTGRKYRYRGRTYTASERGMPPARRTSLLGNTARAGYTIGAEGDRGFTASVYVDFPAPYAALLDPTLVGDRPSGRGGERPIIAPILQDARPELLRLSRTMRS